MGWSSRPGPAHGTYMEAKEANAIATTRRSGYQLQMGAPNTTTVSVVMAPQLSVLGLLRQATSGQSLMPLRAAVGG